MPLPLQTVLLQQSGILSLRKQTKDSMELKQFYQLPTTCLNVSAYQYEMSVQTNTYQYLQYIPKTIHTNTYHNTYHADTYQYIPKYKPLYILMHTMKSNTYHNTHITSLKLFY